MIRTAGTTLHHIFRNNYGINHVEVSKEVFTCLDLKRLLRFNRRIKTFGGHFLRSTAGLETVCPDLVYITFLRDPTDRFISHYNHGMNRGHHSMSIGERVNMLGEANYQVKFLLGAQNLKEREFAVTGNDLEKAKKILTDSYAFVGLAEYFDESLVLMKEILKMSDLDVHFERMHVTQNRRVTRDELPGDLLEEIREANRRDYEIYKYAREELFERQKKSYPGDLERDVSILKEENKHYKFKKSKLMKYRMGKYLFYRPLFKLASYLS